MKHCVQFPDDRFLAIRPCLIAICYGNRPAAKLLGVLLYRYNLRVENKDDAENINAIKAAKGEQADQDTSYRIFRKQAQLTEDMYGEMTEKTLHDTAVPMLQLLGYLDIEEHMQANCYIVHVDRVQAALNEYPSGQLEIFLISAIRAQLEKFRIDLCGLELEEVLIDKKFFLSALEKVLIQNRKISNLKRGRKPALQAARRGKMKRPQNLLEDSKKDKEEDVWRDASRITPRTRDFGLTDMDCQPDLTDLEETVKVQAARKESIPPATETSSQQTSLSLVQSPQQALPAGSVAPVQPGHADGQVTAEQRRVPAASGPNTPVADKAAAAANVPTEPPAPTKRDTNPALHAAKGAGKRAAKSDTATAPDEDADAVALRTAIYNQIVKRRGFAYDTGGRVVAERTCIKTRLAGHYSAAEIDRVHEYLMTRDWKWSKIDNRYHVNACVIADNMKPVLQILAQERDAAPPEQNGVRMNGHRTNPQPVYEIDEARNAHNLAMAKEMAARKRAEREAKAGVK